MRSGLLVEFSGLPGTGKSTLAGWLAREKGAVWLRIDEIENAMRRNGLTVGAHEIPRACAHAIPQVVALGV
jgi:predicted kinase